MSFFLKVQNTTKAKKRKVDNTLLEFLKQDSKKRKTQNENLVQLLTQNMKQKKIEKTNVGNSL